MQVQSSAVVIVQERLLYYQHSMNSAQAFARKKLNLNDLYKLALNSGKLKLKSGKQELFENIINLSKIE